MKKNVEITVIGCGNMGTAHATSYHSSSDFTIKGLISREDGTRAKLAEKLGGNPRVATFPDFDSSLRVGVPDAVSINSYPDTHYAYAKQALELGCHVFVEKPPSLTLEEYLDLMELADRKKRVLVVGFILHHDPIFNRFIEEAKTLGSPLVFRMNLNQQTSGKLWKTHQNLLQFFSPLADCGIHYFDIMCEMTGCAPKYVHAMGVDLTERNSITPSAPDNPNYGQVQLIFPDGSVAWYEAGWGPMMSRKAHFIKDVIGPKGSVSIIRAKYEEKTGKLDPAGTPRSSFLYRHFSKLDEHGELAQPDTWEDLSGLPSNGDVCNLQRDFFLRAIRGEESLENHHRRSLLCMRIALAAEESLRSGKKIKLDQFN